METAFKVLRSAGYAAHALSVAERAGQPDWILDVLLEDMGSYPEALAFIGGSTGNAAACKLKIILIKCNLTLVTSSKAISSWPIGGCAATHLGV